MAGFEGFEEFRKRQREQELGIAEETPVVSEDNEKYVSEASGRKVRRRRHKKPSGKGPVPWYKNRNYYYLVVVAFVIVLLGLFFAPVPFGKVVVEGNKQMGVDEVYRVARIGRPINILQLSTADMERRLRGDLRVASADVSRSFPAEIHISIQERVPLAMLHSEFGIVTVDKTGMVVGVDPVIKDTQAPFISGKKLGNILLGDTISDTDVVKALAYLAHLSPQGWNQISEVNVSNPDQITVYTRDDIPVRLGKIENPAEQAPLSENMLKDIRVRNLAVLYVDANIGAPYIKLK